MRKNTTRSIILPLISALALAVGLYIGAKLLAPTQSTHITNFSTSKVDALFNLLNENYVDKLSADSIDDIVLPIILKKLDPHSVYIKTEDMKGVNEEITGKFEGIGIQFNINEDTVMVVSVISGGPSEKVGLLPGDRIVTVDDSIFAGKKINTDDVIKHLKGTKGSTVKLGIKRYGVKDLIEFEIVRDKIPIYSIDAAYMLDDETAYIKINKFAATTYSEFREAAEKLINQGMKKLVLDLRQNGGGLLNQVVKIVDEFLPEGKMIVYLEGRARKRRDYFANGKGICENIKLAVIIDTWSASASEILAGAIQDNDRGVIVGRRSFGKGLVQETFTFVDNSAIRLTTARYYTPVGRSIQKPYDKGVDKYLRDISDRIMKGELTGETKYDFPDSLKYTTKGGKILYGGGGISPDVYVPLDTSYYSDYYEKITGKGLIYKFALSYADKHRNKLNTLKTASEIEQNLIKEKTLQQFVRYAKSKGVKYDKEGFNKSKKEIRTFLYALIARNIINNEGFYPIMGKSDIELQTAIKELNKISEK